MSASFRGVPFRVKRNELEVGRRGGSFELPFDDKGAASVDLGRRARRFQVAAILIGGTRLTDRDRLIAALEQPGPGLLVHPDYGSVMVRIDGGARLVESTEMGGVTEVEFSAIESRGQAPAPAVTADKRGTVSTKARALREVSRTHLVDTLDLSGAQDFARAANIQTLDTVVGDLHELNGTIGAALAVPGRFTDQIDAIARSTETLINTPAALYDTMDAAFENVIRSAVRVAGALGVDVDPSDASALRVDALKTALANLKLAVSSALALGADDPEPLTADEQESTNRDAIRQTQRAGGLSHAAEAALEMPFESAQDSRAVRDLLGGALAELAASVQDAPLFEALWDLRAAVAQQLSGEELASITDHTPSETTTVFEIAYDLYADSARAGEVLARNNVRHPLFVPGMVSLEVLSE